MAKKKQTVEQEGFEPTKVALGVAIVSALTLLAFALVGAAS